MKLLKKICYDSFMEGFVHGLYILFITFGALTLIFNFEPTIPRFPWDILMDKFGFRVYIPVTTALVSGIVLVILLKSLNFPFLN